MYISRVGQGLFFKDSIFFSSLEKTLIYLIACKKNSKRITVALNRDNKFQKKTFPFSNKNNYFVLQC